MAVRGPVILRGAQSAHLRMTISLSSREDNYTAAVVTPPSMTMVWPVMKVEASEAR
jgi:hypothetical protein